MKFKKKISKVKNKKKVVLFIHKKKKYTAIFEIKK